MGQATRQATKRAVRPAQPLPPVSAGPLPTLRVLTADGVLVRPGAANAAGAGGGGDVSFEDAVPGILHELLEDEDRLLGLYEDLVAVRRIDHRCLALARQGRLGLWAPAAGQEATLVGATRALTAADYLFISYRETLVAYLRGAPATQVLPMWRGTALSGWDPEEYRVTNPAIIVGAHGLHATGYAMAAALDGADEAAVAFFGDGATSQGDIAEALNTAAVATAPVVFLCQNNHYAISVPVGGQTAVQPAQRGRGFGVPALRVDGNDVLAVYAATRLAADHAHAGSGPFLLESVTYRMGPHTTNDDPTRYRDAAETEAWAARDPVERMRSYLEGRGILTDHGDAAIRDRADAAAEAFRSACEELPDPDFSRIFAHVYAAPHPLVDEERRDYAQYRGAESETSRPGSADTSPARRGAPREEALR